MAFQVVPNTVLVRIEGLQDEQLTINTLYFNQEAGAVTPVNMASLGNALDSWLSSQLAPNLSENWASTRIVLVDQDSVTGPEIVIPAPHIGGVASEAAPNNVAACISFRTDFRGRGRRGRNYVPGIPNSVITLNTLSDAFVAAITDAYAQLLGPGAMDTGWEWFMVHRKEGGVFLPEAEQFPITNAFFVTNKVRSMRSRAVGHGA